MFKTLIFGFVAGLVGTIAAIYYVPVVDQHREPSVVSVTPNGGNTESFHVNIPMDRIMVGSPDQSVPLPAGLDWPETESLSGLRAELFKLRNTRNMVVGIASRVVTESEKFGDGIEWVVHLPARGTFYVTMPPESVEGVRRVGTLRAGTREFQPMNGAASERWVANTDDDDEDAPIGHIELVTNFVGSFIDEGPGEAS
jgi:hypothetical protein